MWELLSFALIDCTRHHASNLYSLLHSKLTSTLGRDMVIYILQMRKQRHWNFNNQKRIFTKFLNHIHTATSICASCAASLLFLWVHCIFPGIKLHYFFMLPSLSIFPSLLGHSHQLCVLCSTIFKRNVLIPSLPPATAHLCYPMYQKSSMKLSECIV